MAFNEEFVPRLAIKLFPLKMEAPVVVFLHGPRLTNNKPFKNFPQFLQLYIVLN